MRGDTLGRAVAWSFAAVALVLVVLASMLTTRATAEPFVGTVTAVAGTMSVVVGALVIARRGNHPVGWLFCLSGLAWALYYVGLACAAAAAGGAAVVGQGFLTWASSWTAFLGFGLSPVLVLYIFPTGHLPATTRRWTFRFAVAVVLGGSLAHAVAPGPLEDIPGVINPYGLSGFAGTVALAGKALAWPVLLIAVVGGVVTLARRARTASYVERQQMKWMVFAGIALLVFGCFWGITELLQRTDIAAALSGLFLPLVPLALGIAILRHRLYDIDVLINRTLVYASLSAVLAAIYLATVVLFQRVLTPITAESNLAIAASTLAVAALFRPMRARIQGFIDRRFYREKYSAIATLDRFSTRLRNEVDIDALEAELLVVIRETLHPQTATVWLKAADPSA